MAAGDPAGHYAGAAYGVIPFAKWIGCTRPQIGVMAIGAGLSNNGFTLGAYLCYSLLSPRQRLWAYGLAYVSIQVASTVLLIYPLARHYSQSDQQTQNERSLIRLILGSYVNIRAMVLYAALTGVRVAVMEVPFPTIIDRWHVVTVLFYIGAFGGYFGIGLRLRLGDSKAYLKQHALLAVMKFVFAPILAAVILVIDRFHPLAIRRRCPAGGAHRNRHARRDHHGHAGEPVSPGHPDGQCHLDVEHASIRGDPLPVILWVFG